jgi:ASC-1-like (ASCH) protein
MATDIQIVSTTFELHKDDIVNFEGWFKNELGIKVISFGHYNSNSEMYKNDNTYKKLVKRKSDISKEISLYINKHT